MDWAVCHARPAFREWLKEVGGIRNRDHDEWPWPPQSRHVIQYCVSPWQRWNQTMQPSGELCVLKW